MSKSLERNVEALTYKGEPRYGRSKQAKLTTKQYLVYAWLLSVSYWNAKDREDHYYVYKNSFKIKDAVAEIGITQPTWRSAITALKTYHYIEEQSDKYLIYWPSQSFVPIHIDILKFLIQASKEIKGGYHIVAVYSTIAKYYQKVVEDGNDFCEITVNQIRTIFESRSRHKEDSNYLTYELMFGLFSITGLMKIKTVGRQYSGNSYTAYQISNVKIDGLPEGFMEHNGGSDETLKELMAIVADSVEGDVDWNL